MKGRTNPLPTGDLNSVEAYPFEDGADEIVLRISRYEPDMETPASFQCIIRGRDRTRQWGIGIRPNPVSALEAAIKSWFRPKPGETNKVITERVHKSASVNPCRTRSSR
ncbi:hypothetical protein ACM25O_13225 [Sulfitobacter pontiacus]